MMRHPDGRPWFIHGIAFEITDLNRACEQLTGRSPDQARGHYLWDVFVSEEKELFRTVFEQMCANELLNEYETSFIARDGTQRLSPVSKMLFSERFPACRRSISIIQYSLTK